MASLGKIVFGGKSGKEYRFRVYALGTKLRKRAGIYVITDRSHGDEKGYQHSVLYVGQTEDMSQPFEQHRKAQELGRHGANCICLQTDESEESRVAKEQDLVSRLRPACNES